MIVKCQKNDEQIIESYIGKEYYKCLYLYMNLQRYGIGSQVIDVYMDKRENEIKQFICFIFRVSMFTRKIMILAYWN